ncbi:MAG: hypothetical protein DHS20C02_18750 [Micavibrio sp.]|nr:MAG: hypothetical protein DHS20C02_18750 [Micavibrio sp.]
MSDQDNAAFRLSDRILKALELALEQDDVRISEILTSALDLSMTRNTGGGDFVERRDYSPEMEAAMDKLHALQEKTKSV